jgi:GH24 family phage-related lysozyme (muramidase)
MDYRELTEEQYYQRVRTAIVASEGLHARAQNIGDNRATIGWGYTFNRGNNVEIWRNSGIELSPREWDALQAIDNAPADDRTRLGLAFPRQLNAAESDSLLRASVREYEGPANALNMPLSDERVALVSLTYNRGAGALVGNARTGAPEHPIMDAIRDGDRAEAWFQMRYNCWGSATEYEGGLRKRRYAEAQAFGLYDDPNNVSADEARSVFRMFQLHRGEIDRVERNFGVTVDGQAATTNRIDQANRDYPGMAAQYGQVQTISDALDPARRVLLRSLREEHPDMADRLTERNFNAGQIYLDPGRELRQDENLRREQRNSTTQDADDNHDVTLDSRRMNRERTPREIDSNDLLLGMGGNDTLRAHRGDDILIGGAGRDRMEGGIGQDTYVAGVGDTVMDNDGRGELRWGGRVLNGGSRVDGDPANTYRSSDGDYTYAIEGRNLTVTNRQGESMQIENYARGDMGIRLQDPPMRTGGQRPEDPATQGQAAQAEGALTIERLGQQDRAVYDRMRTVVQARGGYNEEQIQNIAAAGLLEYKRRESVVREPQDINVSGDRLFTSYFPSGRDREPIFHANVRLSEAANIPAQDSLQRLDTMTRQQAAQLPAPQPEQRQEQDQPQRGR